MFRRQKKSDSLSDAGNRNTDPLYDEVCNQPPSMQGEYVDILQNKASVAYKPENAKKEKTNPVYSNVLVESNNKDSEKKVATSFNNVSVKPKPPPKKLNLGNSFLMINLFDIPCSQFGSML